MSKFMFGIHTKDGRHRARGRYLRVPSVAHYLIVHSTRRTVTHHLRAGDGIDTRIIVSGPIAMTPPGIVITVEEIYGAA